MVVSVDNAAYALVSAPFVTGGIFFSTNDGASWARAIEGHTTDIVALKRPDPVRALLISN